MARPGPLLVVSLLLLAGAGAGTGCGNDFDALFPAAAAGPDGGRGPAPPRGDDASVPDGSRTDAASGPLCAPAVPTCAAEAACTGGNCNNTCAGCACTCPKFDCDDGDAQRCTTTCSGGSQCSVTCDIDGPCALIAHGATAARLTCNEKATSCTLVCDGGGSCEGECKRRGDAACSLVCAAGTACLVRCSGDAAACTVDCQGGGEKRECPNGVFTCNRDCP